MNIDGMPTNNIGNQGNVNNEITIIERFIAPGQVVFDIGANIGSWTKEVLNRCPNVQVHVFEPAPSTYETILEKFAESIKIGRVLTNNLAISRLEEIRQFYYYENYTEWSTFYPRSELEKQYNLGLPKKNHVWTTTIDKYAQTKGIEHINFLKIDTEGGEWEALQGAKKLLQKGQIDYIQFAYGGTFLEANTTLKQVFEYLDDFRYLLFKILPNGLEHIPNFLPQYENYEYSSFLAVNERFKSTLLEEAPMAIDLQRLCSQYSLTWRGIIHIGAHDGEEITLYQALGTQRVLFVEANPTVFERLKANIAGHRNVQAVNCAIGNYNGTVNLRVTSFDQSSSILPLKRHQEIYPYIQETHQISVQSRTLDTLLQELEINPEEFNFLVIDIQGAELLALQGSLTVLKHIEAIITEVNYEELYEGCALIDQLDEFLDKQGFERVATATPFHPSWGDAFYVKKPVVTMSTLGKNGRFANQIFQYAFLKIYAKEHNLRVETPGWIGQDLFGHNDSQISQQLPVFVEQSSNIAEARIPNAKTILKAVDFWGYFQYHTKYYAPHKEYFCSLFKPVAEVEEKISETLASLRLRGKTIVGLHLRRGDYGYGYFFIAPSEWYKAWLKGLWETLDEPILFIASDEPAKVSGDFIEYNPVTAKDLGVELPQAEFYLDFYLLSQCDIVAISNSSFSFAACMLNERGQLFMRPDLSAKKLIAFDPWNSEPILRDEEVGSTKTDKANSDLNRLIPPEIKNDEFYAAIHEIAREADIRTVLEIGSSSGQGSTEAFVTGLRENPNRPTLFCMEISKSRFAELQKTYRDDPFVRCYNISSVSLANFSKADEVISFYYKNRTNLNEYPIDTVLGWLAQDVDYLKNSMVLEGGIKKIKKENNIDVFDAVLIDGSEFTGRAELEEVYGAKIILLDDINTFKNYQNFQRLSADKNYLCIAQNVNLRNGYAIFQKIVLPIHFFTIVLNGEPFIRYHIEVFQQLPFQWHWHIVEGVADLKYDTAWSLKLGGQIPDEIHCSGRSNDGTSEYLDELARLYPENITVYRKSKDVFWEGKREMVNAPLENINEECLLWQVDVDELWTVEQICQAWQMFVNNPEKTAAFYWCWYFVGEKLVISTRNCYAENPAQEWLRTWRFKPGCVWAAHEPPRLVEPLSDAEWRDLAAVNPFLHEDTERQGLVFQHFAYVTPEQLRFKEQYYGYKNAFSEWTALQQQDKFPVMLRQYFSWVQDATAVDMAESLAVVPIAKKESSGTGWQFVKPDRLQSQTLANNKQSPTIVIDAVFFQRYKTGIARVWCSLLEEWAEDGFAKHIIVVDRDGTAPEIPGIWYRKAPPYDYDNTAADREILQQICNEEGADLFISTYYTTPISTPSVFMAYDMIPEVLSPNSDSPMWREKHYGIRHASAYIAISQNTANDLVKIFPAVSSASVRVAHCGVTASFSPAREDEINHFKTKYGISKPYFMLVGVGSSYKNATLFFEAFAQLYSRQGFEIVCTGSSVLLDPKFRAYTSGSTVHMLQLCDEELRLSYAGAVALVHPSKYEGFGLPILEAITCACPVITCRNGSIPEVAGEAAIYVNDEDVDGLTEALCEVQKPKVRKSLIAAGLAQAKQFSWSKMAKTVSSALIDTTLLRLNLKDINLIVFPDWTQPEEYLGVDIERVVRAIATHPDKSKMTLLVDSSNISDEDANLALSSIAMNLLMAEDLDVSEGPEISLIGELSEIQWKALIPRLHARIVWENENREAIAQAKAEDIPTWKLEDFMQESHQ
ncbi:methyltransferase FkbM family [Oscillatoria nigro-viridis PCC 7112]|uniref:Methyltransferase FkbM family n=1 Tax=Phormidium nigroviride PCC 7112 TaxID=179408 RepID=K9VDI7_9CYAN|nr:FkbM family methyltransferase [Oscillatoria nigro-viridis]AFZ05325.1 methyltransferase FkbM family [Oscillatoria nigro-viridis PCC 7112]